MPDKFDDNVDIYRDTPVRLLGYANEVGEAFRALSSVKFVWATYGLASMYVLADTQDKAVKMWKKSDSSDEAAKKKSVALAAFDTLTWQERAFASVIVPGFTINRICAGTIYALSFVKPRLGPGAIKGTAAAIGLCCIPFIVHPIDNGVHFVMDKTTRVWIGGSSQEK